MIIKTWFVDKNFTQNEKYIYETGEISVESETEKAYKIKITSDYGTFFKWVPKSCTETGEKRSLSPEELENLKAKNPKKITGNDGRTYLVSR